MHTETKKQKIVRLEASLAAMTADRDNHHAVLLLQGELLSDAADIFEETGLRNVWERFLEQRLGGPSYVLNAVAIWENSKTQAGTPRPDVAALDGTLDAERAEAVAQERIQHGTITAQSGLSVHEDAHWWEDEPVEIAGAAERT